MRTLEGEMLNENHIDQVTRIQQNMKVMSVQMEVLKLKITYETVKKAKSEAVSKKTNWISAPTGF